VSVSRRRFLATGATALGVAAGAGALGSTISGSGDEAGARSPAAGIEPFTGRHQAGIATEQQDRLLFASFDLLTAHRADVADLLRRWTAAARRLTEGRSVADDAAHPDAPPVDTGEATGLDPARLTLTFGFGPGLFTRDGADRYGLAARRPAPLVDIPPFPGDNLDPARSGGDLCVQACSNDPQVAYHAVRNLARIARGTASIRWTQIGFGRTSATAKDQATPRNLMGFKDGTANLRAGIVPFDESVWVAAGDDPAWMVDGSYLVARRIRIFIEVWDRTSLGDQEATIGRDKVQGAPLGATGEFDGLDLTARGADGQSVVPADAHVRLANQQGLGIHILRRGYSFTDGLDARTNQLDAGLFFLAYGRDHRKQFVPMQDRLARGDALNEYIQHVGSAIYAVPPGVATADGWVGESLFTG
jgi:deferrochelatase/peroxidase EfeB